jgi:hypothetical protein
MMKTFTAGGFPNASASTRKLNQHLFAPSVGAESAPAKKRLRQNSEPKLNATEKEFERVLADRFSDCFRTTQAVTFRLGNGVRYTPDFVLFSPIGGTVDAYEVKGYMRDDAAVKLKVAAALYPFIVWRLVWKEDGRWQEQVVLS